MSFVCSLPLFMIIGGLLAGALCILLRGPAASLLLRLLISFQLIADVVLLRYTMQYGSFTYSMGEFPAPWGNELRGGVLECVILLVFLIVLLCSVIAGYRYLKTDIDESKHQLYFSLIGLLSSALCSLVFTNDIFSGYVFLEIMTLACCGLLAVREVGRTTLAAVRYMIMNLLGSGLFLLGVILLYNITGHLLLVPIREAVAEVSQNAYMMPSLTFAVGIMTIGLAIKSGLFPFHFWMPDTYGYATPSTAAVMSSIVSKAYIFLLIKIYWRAIGTDVLAKMPIERILLVLGMAGVVFGSLSALRANNLNRMIAFSSAAQIGYIFMSLGIGGTMGCTAALLHMAGHSVTKSLLFLASPHLADVSGGSLVFRNLQGSALRDRVAGQFTLCGALSMVGVPAFAGFSSKFLISLAAADTHHGRILFPVVFVLAISTVLNALYFLRTIIRIYTRPKENVDCCTRAGVQPDFLIPGIVLALLNLLLGLAPFILSRLLEQGLLMFA